MTKNEQKKILENLDKIWAYLEDSQYFTYDELKLAICMKGYNRETFDIICQIRYGYDVEQMLESEEE